MSDQKRKIRVIIRPWTPRNIPHQIPVEKVKEVLETAYPKLGKILYVGWAKRKVEGKRKLFYLATTGDTPSEAREKLKKSENYGEDIWNLSTD